MYLKSAAVFSSLDPKIKDSFIFRWRKLYIEMETEKLILSTADYVIFTAALIISAAIGIYFRFTGGKQKNNEEYLLAGKDMAVLPVSISLMATFMSATTLMGIPTEMYLFGTNMTFMNIGFALGPIIATYVFIPVYFNNGVSTAYEYLEMRFGITTRRILSIVFIFQTVLFTSLVLYAPALALSAVTNLSLWTSVISIGIVCTFYCTLGGMKAVLWTDVFQAVLMYACLLAIIVKGCLDLGGISNVFNVSNDGGRLLIPSFSLDVSIRYTMLSVFLQGMIITTSLYGCGQTQVQRILTLRNVQRSRIATLLSIPMLVSFQLLCCLCGLIFYVFFRTCDPITSPAKPIHAPDQIMPLFITSTMSEFPGLPGLCISGIFSASLSTISSSVNSVAAVTSEDIIGPFWPNLKRSVTVTKIITLAYGALCIVLTFLVASLGNLVKTSVIVVGMISGPTLGVYLLASLSRIVNEKGAVLGVIAGVILAACLSFIPAPRKYPHLPLSNECPHLSMFHNESQGPINLINANFSEVAFSTPSEATVVSDQPIDDFLPKDEFPLSFMWISPLSLVATLIVGYTASLIFRYCGKSAEVPSIYLSPIRNLFTNVPKKEIKTINRELEKNETSKL